MLLVSEELLSEVRYADRAEGQERWCAAGQLGVDLGGNLLCLLTGIGNSAANGLAAVAVVGPPRAVMGVEGDPADAESRCRALLPARHGTNSPRTSCASSMHQGVFAGRIDNDVSGNKYHNLRHAGMNGKRRG